MKRVRVVLSPEAEEVHNHLNREAPKSSRAIEEKKDLIKANPHYRAPITKAGHLPKSLRICAAGSSSVLVKSTSGR